MSKFTPKPDDRLTHLEEVEKELYSGLKFCGEALKELGKDKPSLKQAENHASNFIKTMERVESGIGKQIIYLTQVSTAQQHEGSSYASQKELNMAYHRLEHSKTKLRELDELHAIHMQQRLDMSALFAPSNDMPSSQ